MAYSGIFSETLVQTDFDSGSYDAKSIAKGIPVQLLYKVEPGNEVAFGSGSNSMEGVRTARVLQIKPMDNTGTAVIIPCKYELLYLDVNQLRQTHVKRDLTSNVLGDPGTSTPNQGAYLPETAGVRVGAYGYLCIRLTPLADKVTSTFSIANTVIQLPITRYTLETATGE